MWDPLSTPRRARETSGVGGHSEGRGSGRSERASFARRVLRRLRSRVRARRGAVPQAFPPGAFYSPVVDPGVVLAAPDVDRIWPSTVEDPPGIDFRAEEQLRLVDELAEYRLPSAADDATPAYDPLNEQFPPHDAAVLHAMVRHLRPRRMVEVGCGWSTTVTARAIREGGLGTELTCIEPYPREFVADIPQVSELRIEKVEHTPLEVFDQLAAGDVLFIDSSHVAKTGSDVVHQLLHVVPRLRPGVVVHVHDIFLPEDYPRGWVEAGFNWNEQYLLQALLVGNAGLRVLVANHWMALRHPEKIEEAFGPFRANGSSCWFEVAHRGG